MSKKQLSALVLGSDGEIGSAITKALLESNASVITTSRKRQPDVPNSRRLELEHPERFQIKNAVDVAFTAGVGSEVTVSLGGKIDNQFSQPVETTARVMAVSQQHEADAGERGRVEIGRVVLLRAGPVHTVVMATAGFAVSHPMLYEHLGLDIGPARAVVVKTASNFQYFAEWRRELIRADTPGMTQSDLTAFDWTRVPRPIYPLDSGVGWNG